MEEKVFKLIYDYLNNKYENTDINNMFIVWSCYILGNRKYLISSTDFDEYFEVTFDNNEKQWYIDEYNKINNICIKDLDCNNQDISDDNCSNTKNNTTENIDDIGTDDFGTDDFDIDFIFRNI